MQVNQTAGNSGFGSSGSLVSEHLGFVWNSQQESGCFQWILAWYPGCSQAIVLHTLVLWPTKRVLYKGNLYMQENCFTSMNWEGLTPDMLWEGDQAASLWGRWRAKSSLAGMFVPKQWKHWFVSLQGTFRQMSGFVALRESLLPFPSWLAT